jgi:hypothetical protein
LFLLLYVCGSTIFYPFFPSSHQFFSLLLSTMCICLLIS